MPTIKGPFKIGKGNVPKELVESAKESAKKMGLVFGKEAEELKAKYESSKNKPVIDDKEDETIEVESKAEEKELKYSKEDLEELTFSELKTIGNKMHVTGRSKSGIIEDILGIQNGTKEPEL